jgi:hypothetical protein
MWISKVTGRVLLYIVLPYCPIELRSIVAGLQYGVLVPYNNPWWGVGQRPLINLHSFH